MDPQCNERPNRLVPHEKESRVVISTTHWNLTEQQGVCIFPPARFLEALGLISCQMTGLSQLCVGNGAMYSAIRSGKIEGRAKGHEGFRAPGAWSSQQPPSQKCSEAILLLSVRPVIRLACSLLRSSRKETMQIKLRMNIVGICRFKVL